MKFCPTCETRYDEEILRFCTKDGTPLVDENQPSFTELPSESIEAQEDDLGEETMVRYKPPKDLLDPEPPQPEIHQSDAPRIVIPMNEQKKEQNVRSRVIPPYQPPPSKPNTGKVVALTIFGTLVILALGLGLFMFMRNEDSSNNKNLGVNTNPPDTNMNGSLGITLPTPSSSNTNTSFNINFNTNTAANLKTPPPTPSPKPSPSVNINANANLGNTITNAPSPTPILRPTSTMSTPTPRPATPTPNATPRISPTVDRTSRPPANSNDQ